jgi:hypothetical protein
MASYASPFNNDSIHKWETIPQKEFKGYALGLKAKIGHKTIEAFTIQKAKKRRVAFYNNAWLYEFVIKEGVITKNMRMLSVDTIAQIVLTDNDAWQDILKQYPPQLTTKSAVLDFFALTHGGVITTDENLPKNLRNQVHSPRIMFQTENTFTIQSFIREGDIVYLALHQVNTKNKTTVIKGKSNFILNKNHSSIGVSFSKTPLLHNRMGWVGITPILSR